MDLKETLRLKIFPNVGYFIFIGIALTIFFFSSFVIVLFRTKSSEKIKMPNLVGKNYIRVHNELERLRFKVKLETERNPGKNDGMIINQSIPAGKLVESGSRLYLTINEGYDRIEIPDLKGQTLKRTKSILEKVLSGDTYVSLEIGGITYTSPQNNESPDTIIEQFPPAGTITNAGEKIYLLVTSSQKLDQSVHLENQPIGLLTTYFHRNKYSFKIDEIISPEYLSLNGLVKKGEWKDGTFHLSVYFKKTLKLPQFPSYEYFEYEIDDDGLYTTQITFPNGNSTNDFLPEKYKKDEVWKFLVYKNDDVEIKLLDANLKKIYKDKREF
jgi:hypothetical protein